MNKKEKARLDAIRARGGKFHQNAAADAASAKFNATGPMHLVTRTGLDPETTHDRSRKKTDAAPLPRKRPRSY